MQPIEIGLDTIASILLALIFLAIAMIHIYWVMGGQWGHRAAIPKQMYDKMIAAGAGSKITIPTAMVALGMVGFSFVALSHIDFYQSILPGKFVYYASWAIALIFLIRAIGNFKFVGFFQERTDDVFSKRDRMFFSPLCLLISGLMFYLILG